MIDGLLFEKMISQKCLYYFVNRKAVLKCLKILNKDVKYVNKCDKYAFVGVRKYLKYIIHMVFLI